MKSPRHHAAGMLPIVTVIVAAALLAGGCAGSPAKLTVRSTQRKALYAQHFTQAFASQTEDGTHEFILVADDAIKSAPRHPGGPLQPVTRTPLRQVVYVRVMWAPLNGVERDVTRNATIDWYVFGDTAGGATDMLQYQGTAYARIKEAAGDAKQVTISEGTIKPHAARGGLSDPIGIGRLEGRFKAVENPHRVQELLAAARARTLDASAAAR